MNYKKEIGLAKRGRQIAILACISILALAGSVWNAAGMQGVLAKSAQVYCGSILGQMASAINDGVYYKKIELKNVADSLSNVYVTDNRAEVNEFLMRKAGILEFSALLLVDKQGNSIAQYMEPGLALDLQQLMGISSVQASFQGQVSMGFCDGQTLFYSAPVYTENNPDQVLVGIRSKEKMQSLLDSNAFQDTTISCIISSRGELILSPTDIQSFTYLENVFEDPKGRKADELLKMQEDLSNGKEGMIQFTDADGKENFLAYNSLGTNDWVLLTIVPVDLISGGTSAYILRSLMIIVGTSLVFFVLLMIVYRIYANHRKQLSRLAFVDSVTGGMNNKAFQLSYEKAAREQKPFFCAIVLMNTRDFKLVNEKFGFEMGDEMLRYIYQVIGRHLKTDLGEFATRSAMDRFFLFLKEQDPQTVERRLQEIVADINVFEGTKCPRYRLEFRKGCCMVTDPQLDIQTLQDRARMAAHDAAVLEKEGCVFYNDQIAAKLKKENALYAMFDEALANHEFQVYLQPKVDLKTNRPNGAEALVRWRHPEKGLIPPIEFIPLFERNGKICRLDFYVFEEVCRFCKRRQEEGKAWYPVSVNLSSQHFYEEDFLEKFYRTYQEYDLPENSIEFELTESMFFDQEHIERIKKEILRMHEMGFRCSMDDFGCGYSSLGLLKEFDVDTLKMDRSFFLDMSSEKARDIIQSVIELAAKLKVETVAEGIEQMEQMEFLYSIQCDTVQGFFFSPPLPIPEFERWVSRYEEESERK